MTLNEAIKHAREVAESRTDLCEECRAEHEQLAEWLEELVRLREENERLKSVEFTCSFVKPHKVLECPIFDEIVKAKADTVREMQERLQKRIASAEYRANITRKTVKKEELIEQANWVLHKVVPDTIDQIAKEILEDNDG